MKLKLDKLSKLDTPLVFCYAVLILIGLFIQLDITSANGHINYFMKQLIFTVLSVSACLVTFIMLRLNWLKKYFWFIYLITIALLVIVLKFGVVVNGARRVFYLPLGFTSISVQPSLIARVVLIILFARVIYTRRQIISNTSLIPFLKNFLPLIIFTIPVFVLIVLEKHFSAILISAATLISLLFLAGIKKSTIVIIIILVLLSGTFLVFQKGAEYRRERINIFLENSLIANFFKGQKIEHVSDYQTRHSLICLTSGKLLGTTPEKGFGKYFYLPEPRTDYVFSIIGEEFGLLGALFVIFVFMGLVYRGLNISSRQKNLFLKLLGYGISLNIFFNMLINIGVAVAAIPPTGVTLPFISHGGSAMLVNSVSVGILLLLANHQELKCEKSSN